MPNIVDDQCRWQVTTPSVDVLGLGYVLLLSCTFFLFRMFDQCCFGPVHVLPSNEEVKARIGNTIGPYEDLLTSVKRRKLK